MNNTFTITLNTKEQSQVQGVLVANGWKEVPDGNQYVSYRFKSISGSTAILYSSGKLVFQGRENFTPLIANIKEEIDSDMNGFESHIGVDEVGKGDYFGPLVVVGCFVDEEFAKKTKLLGFADSKKFTDGKISKLFNSVKEYPYYYSSIVNPVEYNMLTKKYGNVSILLAKQHSLVIEKGLEDLKSKGIKCENVVIDQFSSSKNRVIDELGVLGKSVNFEQFHKGENDIAVAVASVIARGIFLEEWEKMCQKYDFQFPKGASNVLSSARKFVERFGADELELVAKTGFKTTKSIMNLF